MTRFDHTNLGIENEYPKLVRDRIPEIIKEKTGRDAKQKVLIDDEEFLDALLAKIIEEAVELNHSKEADNLEEELADIFEIIDAILKLKGKTTKDIAAIQEEKRRKRGGFEKRILMLERASREPLGH